MKLRPYQQAAFDAAVSWMKKSLEPAVIDIATGGGKSWVIAAIANWVNSSKGKKVLCLQPSKELVEQNREKYLTTGNPASVFSASIGKNLKHPVIFGSPLSVGNSIDKFNNIAVVIIDECDCITPTIKNIISKLKDKNKNLRVLGLTATPYRMNTGYIYQYNIDGSVVSELETRDPYFHSLIYRVTASELIEQGYLTPPTTDINDGYHTSHLELDKKGNFDSNEIEKTFVGKGRLTSEIVADIVAKSQNRKGAMIFAVNRNHLKEICESLPKGKFGFVTGACKNKDRESTINRFKNQEIKYIVSIGALTTGFDAPHVDVIAVLRLTESARLLQQIIGRGTRLHEDKKDFLFLDYAENVDRHFPDGDVFNPEIKARALTEGFEVSAHCPGCGFKNVFSGRKNNDDLAIDENGYFIDLMGQRIVMNGKPMPAHYGRSCMGYTLIKGVAQKCNYKWSFKECPECEHENDIAARFCKACKAELIDPNEKLRLEHAKIKRDPYTPSPDKVLGWTCREHTSKTGNKTLEIQWQTECRKFKYWYMPKHEKVWEDLCMAVFGKIAITIGDFLRVVDEHGKMPKTIVSAKSKRTGFYVIYKHERGEI